MIYIIEQRKRGPVCGQMDKWKPDPASAVFVDPPNSDRSGRGMAMRQAAEWNETCPEWEHRAVKYGSFEVLK